MKGVTQPNEDGSYDVFFGPEAPQGKEGNWIQTVPGKGWFPILRCMVPWKRGSIRRGGRVKLLGLDSVVFEAGRPFQPASLF